jgi:hypothetical protein
MKKHFKFGFLLIGVIILSVVLSGCAHKETVEQLVVGHTHGFWSGLLHGFIAPFDFVGMLFSDRIVMYAPNNNGAWYAFGFLLGSGGWGFFGNKGANYRRKSRRDYGSAEVL